MILGPPSQHQQASVSYFCLHVAASSSRWCFPHCCNKIGLITETKSCELLSQAEILWHILLGHGHDCKPSLRLEVAHMHTGIRVTWLWVKSLYMVRGLLSGCPMRKPDSSQQHPSVMLHSLHRCPRAHRDKQSCLTRCCTFRQSCAWSCAVLKQRWNNLKAVARSCSDWDAMRVEGRC